MRHRDPAEALWTFHTPRFAVCYFAEPEDTDPEDHFQFPEDIEAVRSGAVDWFQAALVVFVKPLGDGPAWLWVEVEAYYLGACAYKNARAFAEGENRNGYFRDMVREAVANARRTLFDMPHLRTA